MENMYYIITMTTLLFLITSFTMNRNHLLFNLLLLELLILSAILSMLMTVPTMIFNIIFLLTIAVCEAATGLSLMVRLLRTKGNDLMKTTTFMKW